MTNRSQGLRQYMLLIFVIFGILLIAIIFPVLSMSVTHMEEDLISSRLSSDINYIEDLIGDGEWSMKGDSICRGDVVVGDGTEKNANLKPFLQHEEKTGTFAYVFIRCSDEGLTYVESTPTQSGYQQGHFLRAAGSTKDPNGNSIVGTYMDKKVADILDAEDMYDGEANVAGGMIYCRYETLKDHDGDVIGAIVVGRGINELKEQISNTTRTVVIAGVLAIIVGCILLYLLMNRWVAAMRRSTLFLQQIETGDIPEERLSPQGMKEVDILNQGINSLADTLTENEELRVKSETDQLTGLVNRFGLNHYGAEMLDACVREGNPLALGVLDIDYFKYYNDNYGHQKGDECIIRIGEVLKRVEEPGRILAARFGGDEFIVVTRGLDDHELERLADRIKNEVVKENLPHAFSEVSSNVTISQGYYISVPEEGQSLSDYLKIADSVMYDVKNGEKDGYRISLIGDRPVHEGGEENHTSQPEHIDWSTYHDHMTELLNKEGFFREVGRILKDEPDEEYYMVCTNIRGFKLVNQFFGYDKGNEVLIDTANMIKSGAIEYEAAGRIHGDHFAMLITAKNYDEDALRENFFNQSKKIRESEYALMYHLGVYMIEDNSMDASIICDRAEMAISDIHNEAGNALSYYESSMMEHVLKENEIISEFDEALRAGQFKVFLQPIVDNRRKVLGAEALVRWDRGEGEGIVSPVDFIGILEKTGLIHVLDSYVWEESAKILSGWKGTELEDLFISVNVSPHDINYIDIEEKLEELTERYGIRHDRINPEFTETALIDDTERYIELITSLREKGFTVEIDDFGTGYSSLNMLRDIAADVLKIDRHFLKATENTGRNRVILRSIMDMSRKLGMSVIVEGVETEEQYEVLLDMNCNMLQGYLFSKPVPQEEFERLYSDDQHRE